MSNNILFQKERNVKLCYFISDYLLKRNFFLLQHEAYHIRKIQKKKTDIDFSLRFPTLRCRITLS